MWVIEFMHGAPEPQNSYRIRKLKSINTVVVKWTTLKRKKQQTTQTNHKLLIGKGVCAWGVGERRGWLQTQECVAHSNPMYNYKGPKC